MSVAHGADVPDKTLTAVYRAFQTVEAMERRAVETSQSAIEEKVAEHVAKAIPGIVCDEILTTMIREEVEFRLRSIISAAVAEYFQQRADLIARSVTERIADRAPGALAQFVGEAMSK